MGVVDLAFYTNTYHGEVATQATFPVLDARAEDITGSLTHWQVSEETIERYPALVQMLYKKAVCAQIDYFAENGLIAMTASDGRGFTVGKVSVRDSRRTETESKTGSLICPLALQYLEQSGLMNPAVNTMRDIPLLGGWLC